MRNPAFILLIMMASCLPAMGGALVWEKKSLSFNPKVSESEVIAHFQFENKSGAPVEIKSISTSCDCLTASADNESYAAGEKGEITATFMIEDQVGAQSKKIYLETDDPKEPRTTLMIEVMVPKIAQIEPDPLRWLPGESLSEKRIRIIVEKGVTLKLGAIKSSDPSVSATTGPTTTPGVLEIAVTPGNRTNFSGDLRIESDFPKEHPRALIAHFQISR